MRALALRAGAAVVAVAIGATACGSSTHHSSTSSTATTPMAASSSSAAPATSAPTESVAATLRAGLDALLRQHVDLTGLVVTDAVNTGLTSASTQAAVSALDGNTQALGAAIGQLYGSAAQQEFLKLWRAHIGFFVTYVKGDVTNSAAMKAQANSELDGYRQQFGQFVATATNGALPAAAVAQELVGHVQTLETAIDAIVAKSPAAAGDLQMAAMHMDGTAAVLAAGIAKAKGLSGDAGSSAASLRAALTGLLVQHVAQTGVLVQTAVNTGLTSAATVAALTALDQNTQQLGAAIGSIYGSAGQQEFLKLWRAHIGFFVNYTKGEATGNSALKQQAQSQLDGYRQQFGQFIAAATKGALPAGAVAQELVGHVQTLEAAIDAIVTKSPTAAGKLSMAELHMLGTADVLAKAIAGEFPSKFTG